MNGPHQVLICVADVNLLSKTINTMKNDTEALLGAIKEVCLEVNVDKTSYMFLSHHQIKRPNV
jgi:hypothetical protein